MSALLDRLVSRGIEFYVKYIEFEYNGYSSRVSLINDESLKELHVHHDIAWGHSGKDYWQVECYDKQCRCQLLYDSRKGLTSDLIQEVINKFQTAPLALPVLTEEDFLFREIDSLYMELFGRHAQDSRKNTPRCLVLEFLKIELRNLRDYKEAKNRPQSYEIEEPDVLIL